MDTCLKEIRLCAPNMLTIRLKNQRNWEGVPLPIFFIARLRTFDF